VREAGDCDEQRETEIDRTGEGNSPAEERGAMERGIQREAEAAVRKEREDTRHSQAERERREIRVEERR
jgi:hypothetical protein